MREGEATIGEQTRVRLGLVYALLGAAVAVGLAVGGWAGSSVTAADLSIAVDGVAKSAVSDAVFDEYKNTTAANFDGVRQRIEDVQRSQDRTTDELAKLREAGDAQAAELRGKIDKLEDLIRGIQAQTSTGEGLRGR